MAGGATKDAAGILTFPLTGGHHDTATGATHVTFGGSVHYQKYEGSPSSAPPGYTGPTDIFILDVLLAEPEIVLDGDQQILTMDVVSRNPGTWELIDYGRVVVGHLQVGGLAPTVAGGTTTWTDIPASLSQLGANDIFFGQYRPGEALDPVTFTYTGPGGPPDLGEHWDEPGSTGLAADGTGPVHENRLYSLIALDQQRLIAHYSTRLGSGSSAVTTLRAFDLRTLAPIGEGYAFPTGTNMPTPALFDSTEGRIFLPGSGGVVDSYLQWDAQAQRYVRESSTIPFLGVRNGFWDPVGQRAVNIQRVVPSGVSSTDYDLHQWYLHTYTEQPDGQWVTDSLPLPNAPTGLNRDWYVSSFGLTVDPAAVASDGSILLARTTLRATAPAVPPTAPPLQRLVIGDDSVAVTEVDGTGIGNDFSRFTDVYTGPDGVAYAVRASATTRPGLVQQIQVAEDGTGVALVGDRVDLGDMNAVATSWAVDPTDGMLWVVGRRTKDLAAVRGGRILYRQFFASLHPDDPGIAVGPDHTVYAQTLQGEDADTYGFGRFTRLGLSPGVTDDPDPVTVTLGVGQASAPVSFTVAAEGTPAPTVQWQVAPAGSGSFTDLEGATEATLAFDATLADDGRSYRAVASNPAGETASAPATLTVESAPAVAIQPLDVTVVEGSGALFQVGSTGNPTPEVQWQLYSQGFWVSMEGATDSFLTIPDTNLDMAGARFRARLRNAVATVHSRTVTLTVTPRSDDEMAVVGGELDWGVRQSFRTYIRGPIAHGAIATSDGAAETEEGTFTFPALSGTAAGDQVDATFGGAVRFTGHQSGDDPLLDVRVDDVRLDLDGDTGTLVADVVSRGLEDGALATYDDVAFATLDLSGHGPAPVEGGLRWTGVPATLTAAGAPAFADFYEPGSDLDPLTFTLLLDEVAPPTRTATESFVTAALTDFLGGEPSTDDVADWAAALDGGRSRASFLSELAISDAWLAALVDRFYQDTLGRPADAVGRAHWIGRLRSGAATVAQVAAAFYASDEYYQRTGGTPTAWVSDLYQGLLGRSPDSSGLAHWIGQVATRGRGVVARRLYQSPESGRARVQALYQDLLGRPADGPGLAHWTPRVLRHGDLVLAVQLAASAEYGARAAARFP